ncbi:hypothetical protein IWZ01DRAFT_507119 [Phyllosticta capitalensis]
MTSAEIRSLGALFTVVVLPRGRLYTTQSTLHHHATTLVRAITVHSAAFTDFSLRRNIQRTGKTKEPRTHTPSVGFLKGRKAKHSPTVGNVICGAPSHIFYKRVKHDWRRLCVEEHKRREKGGFISLRAS